MDHGELADVTVKRIAAAIRAECGIILMPGTIRAIVPIVLAHLPTDARGAAPM